MTAPETEARAGRADRLARWLAAYDAQGIHRSDTPADHANAAWLEAEGAALGARVRREGFPFPKLTPQEAWLQVGGRRFEGVPAFDAGLTGPAGETGALGLASSAAPIGVALDAPVQGPHPRLDTALALGMHRALVAWTVGPLPGLRLRNAEQVDAPFATPVLQLGGAGQDWLAARVRAGAEATVLLTGTRAQATAENVILAVEGRDPAAAPVIVMTPRTSWWHTSAEQGTGVALQLEILREMAAHRPRRPVWGVFTSGHELGYRGIQYFLKAHPELGPGAHAWLHLGSSLGAADGRDLWLYASEAGLSAQARDALAAAGVTAPEDYTVGAMGLPAGGESRHVQEAGGRYLSLAGSCDLFHLAEDRWPQAVHLPFLTALAEGYCRLVATLAEAD